MVVFDKPKSLCDTPLHYCPGCTHGIIHRLVAETIDTLPRVEQKLVSKIDGTVKYLFKHDLTSGFIKVFSKLYRRLSFLHNIIKQFTNVSQRYK